MTTCRAVGSGFFAPIILAGCASSAAQPGPPLQATPAPAAAHRSEACLGLADHGVFSDLDPEVQIALPGSVDPAGVTARIDDAHHVLVVSIDDFPRKAYPLAPADTGAATLDVGRFHLALRAGDRDELRPLLAEARIREGRAAHDLDDDGIPDPLDILIGAKKELLNGEAYTAKAEAYIGMTYPMGDVPRTIGVCTDVIVRAVRNSGLDLQRALHEDIRRARSSYPMVKGLGDPSIDQRRVGTLLPYFLRHWERHGVGFDDPSDPPRPGDVIFMDTFPDRPGPDHIGILSDAVDARGLPLVINNWTDGTVVAEMDLLTFVPVLYRFRLPP